MNFVGLIMAGGVGSRMKSNTNKLLHKILGRELIKFPVNVLKKAGAKEIIVVLGKHNKKQIEEILNNKILVALQEKPLGTADAVKSAKSILKNKNTNVLITVGDNPYLDSETIIDFYKFHNKNDFDVSLITTEFDNPPSYGRVIRNNKGEFVKIVEEIEATEQEKKVREVSSSIFFIKWRKLAPFIEKTGNKNQKKEFFLPDAINEFSDEGGKIGIYKTQKKEIVKGINTRADLIEAINYFNKLNIKKHIKKGITILSPESTFIEFNVDIGKDSIIYPFNYITSGTKVKQNSQILPFSHYK